MDCRTQLASMAIDEVDKGDFEMATKILTTSIRLEPNNHELYFERSICNHKLANYQASLDDANAAIRLNPSDYNIHYQKGLAQIGLSQFSEAVTSFKKAIELRAKQEDSKLSDIFKLLRDATNELNTARRRPGGVATTATAAAAAAPSATIQAKVGIGNGSINGNAVLNNTAPGQASIPPKSTIDQTPAAPCRGISSDPVDSTTDKLSPPAIASRLSQNATKSSMMEQPMSHAGFPTGSCIKNGTNNLVAPLNRNNNQKQYPSSFLGAKESIGAAVAAVASTTTPSRVSSSAVHQPQVSDHLDHHRPMLESIGHSSGLSNEIHNSHVPATSPTIKSESNSRVSEHNQPHQHLHDPTKVPPSVGSFEWNIRRSERIFLHNSSEPGTSGPNEDTASQSRARLGSNPSSVSSGKGASKRPHERNSDMKQPPYPTVKTNGTSSVLDSEIDVDDCSTYSNLDGSGQTRKRVMVTPSSSMPATSQQGLPAANSKEDSYSSKYKRLRRDRERARRGTTKLCTIKPGDLDELHKVPRVGSEKRSMRVIAPIDGWLYSGQLSIDDNVQDNNESPHYVVKLDGDSSGSSYLFTRDTVLNDVIKEVRVKSVSELRKGARICCYWSRTYKCLSTGVVTSRTFEATKSLVSVKYDNGDLSALPLEDLRLLPPDYPKYMSNCDPLLLAKNGDTADPLASPSKTSRIIVGSKSTSYKPLATYSRATKNSTSTSTSDGQTDLNDQYRAPDAVQQANDIQATEIVNDTDQDNTHSINGAGLPTVESMRSALDDDTIPPTDETINFITSEGNPDAHGGHMQRNEQQDSTLLKNNIMTTSETAPLDASRASSEENNYGIEYRPWVFEGSPKRSKRNGRTYRDIYPAIRRGGEVIKVGDSAELMPRDESIPPFVAKIDGLWATSRGEMRVRVRWYYRLSEAGGEPYELADGNNALFETDHFDENDIQSIWRTTKILSWTDYARDHLGHVNRPADGPKVFYLAGHYDPVRCVKHLRSDVKGI